MVLYRPDATEFLSDMGIYTSLPTPKNERNFFSFQQASRRFTFYSENHEERFRILTESYHKFFESCTHVGFLTNEIDFFIINFSLNYLESGMVQMLKRSSQIFFIVQQKGPLL